MNFSIFPLLGDNYFYVPPFRKFLRNYCSDIYTKMTILQRYTCRPTTRLEIIGGKIYPFVTKLFTWKIFTRSAISLDRVFGNWQFHVRSHFICIYTRNVGRVPHPSPYYWSLPAEIIMLRNNERHMVTLRLLTRIIIAGIDYMPFRAVNSVNHERIYDTIRDREHIEAGNASSKMQQVRPRIRLDKRIVKILILAIPFFFKHYCM